MPPIRLVVIDDHRCIADALRTYLETCPDISMVGSAQTADEGLGLVLDNDPDIAIVDIRLPCPDQEALPNVLCSYGIGLIRQIHQLRPHIGILALTGEPTPAHKQAAIKSGACGYLSKGSMGPDIANTIREANQGKIFYEQDSHMPLEDLTGRELEILELIAHGLTKKQIASRLHISPYTVATHRKNICSKLGVSTSIEAVSLALHQANLQEIFRGF